MFPQLGVPAVKAKLDTGARSSSFHALDIETFWVSGEEWVRFEVHPEQRTKRGATFCQAPVLERRKVRSSNGRQELRIFIHTLVLMGEQAWPIELSLTRRCDMGFRLLLGREAIRGKFLVDPGRSYLFGKARPRGTRGKKARLS